MKSLFELFRISLLLGVTWMLLAAGETDSQAAATPPLPTVQLATTLPATPAPTGQGAALLVAAYGFLILLRRRGLRVS